MFFTNKKTKQEKNTLGFRKYADFHTPYKSKNDR